MVPEESSQHLALHSGLRADAVECLRAWCKQLRRHRFTRHTIQQAVGVQYADELSASDREGWLARLEGRSDATSVWLRLFWLEASVRAEIVASHAGPLLALGRKSGLLRQRGRFVQATLRAEAADGLVVWADRRFADPVRKALVRRAGDPVYPPSADSFQLAHILPPLAGSRFLDLCTGSGVIALIAAKARAKAVGVDVDPRAVTMARLNAAANNLRSVQFAVGDLYAPVASQRFHCIAANPPFVCSPYATAPKYHSGGPHGDAVLQRVLAGWAEHLHRGGRAVAISQVGLRRGETLSERARSWLQAFDGRCLVVEFARADALTFAAAQASFAIAEGMPSYRRELQRWVRFLARHGVHEVAAVLVAAERSGVHHLEVVSAVPVVVPVPLNKAATQVVRDWWSHGHT
ncbi:MAG: methyltransferase [Candidatus Binatia bacterium]|nr:methyltransferase [Candidatus Binatia bacterium]